VQNTRMPVGLCRVDRRFTLLTFLATAPRSGVLLQVAGVEPKLHRMASASRAHGARWRCAPVPVDSWPDPLQPDERRPRT